MQAFLYLSGSIYLAFLAEGHFQRSLGQRPRNRKEVRPGALPQATVK